MNRAPPPQVLVTHPGRQHSHQAALALYEAGMLQGYWSGVPGTRRLGSYAPVAIAPELAQWLPIAVGLRRLARALPSTALRARLDFAACRTFDLQVAGRLTNTQATAVVACEISALATFRRARQQGLITILDAPSFHHCTQDAASMPLEDERLHQRINAVKDAEIEAADHIVTVSELARRSYVEAGADAGQVHALTLGVDLSLFHPADARDPEPEMPTFVFAGASTRRKGADILVQAFQRAYDALGGRARLMVAGPRGDAAALLERAAPRGIVVHGLLPQERLRDLFTQADCFVLPSRHDSFGMAVVEAMACGLPAIVSEMVGSKELIREERNGWVVPAGDATALAERMIWCARHMESLRAMRDEARATAEAADWRAYRRRFAELLSTLAARR